MTSLAHIPLTGKEPKKDYLSPDAFFAPKSDASGDSAYEMVSAFLTQARASVVALSANGEDLNRGFTLSQDIILSLLWATQTQIELAQNALTLLAKTN